MFAGVGKFIKPSTILNSGCFFNILIYSFYNNNILLYLYIYIYYLLYLSYYSHSNPPFTHSYTNPTVNTNKNINIVQYPIIFISHNTTLQGNKNDISKSNIINNIPTKKNLTSNFCLESPNGSNPHSNTDDFSSSPLFIPNIYDAPGIILDNTILNTINNNIGVYSNIL